MSFVVHFTGPSYSQQFTLQPGAPAMTVGRDDSATICLPDPERLISRHHISLQWSDAGARLEVLSKINSVITSRGEFTFGQQLVLNEGDTAQLGRFSIRVVAGAAQPAAAPPAWAAAPAPGVQVDDPFLRGAAGRTDAEGPASVFDDPFFRPAPSTAAALPDAHAAMQAMSSQPAPGGFTAGSGARSNEILAGFGSARATDPASSIDDFLSGPRNGGGLGASSLLKPTAMDNAPRMAIDHVHDFNLPVSLGGGAFSAVMPPAAAPRPAPPAVDPLAALASDQLEDMPPTGWDALHSPPAAGPKMKKVAAPMPSMADDPFSSSTMWRIAASDLGGTQSGTSTPDDQPARAPANGAPSNAGAGTAQALQALCRGLGLGKQRPGELSEREWEQMGRAVRNIVEGMAELMNVRSEMKRELRASDRTMLGGEENNPLKTGIPIEELVYYMLFMPTGAAGYMAADKALEEALNDLRTHEFASLAASRAAVEGAIGEFDPDKLRPALLKGKRVLSLLENAKLWEYYSEFYEKKRSAKADWLEQLFNRFFMPTYLRETARRRPKP